MVLDSWMAERVGVAPVNLHALEVLGPFAVAFSRSAVPGLVPSVPLCAWLMLSVGWWAELCTAVLRLRLVSVV